MTQTRGSVQRITQQSILLHKERGSGLSAENQFLTSEEVEHRALRVCVPTCFYMLGYNAGYVEGDFEEGYSSFISKLDWRNYGPNGWWRPKLSRELRRDYSMSIVSWAIGGNFDYSDATISRMVEAGYLETEDEIAFFMKNIIGKSPREVVQAGYPLLIGVLPGFASNKAYHGVILTEWTDKKVSIVDPDERNPNFEYEPEHVEKYINPNGGGCTIVLPRGSVKSDRS